MPVRIKVRSRSRLQRGPRSQSSGDVEAGIAPSDPLTNSGTQRRCARQHSSCRPCREDRSSGASRAVRESVDVVSLDAPGCQETGEGFRQAEMLRQRHDGLIVPKTVMPAMSRYMAVSRQEPHPWCQPCDLMSPTVSLDCNYGMIPCRIYPRPQLGTGRESMATTRFTQARLSPEGPIVPGQVIHRTHRCLMAIGTPGVRIRITGVRRSRPRQTAPWSHQTPSPAPCTVTGAGHGNCRV